MGVFREVARRLGPDFGVMAGDRFYDPSLETVAGGEPWFHPCKNHFIAGRRLLVQRGLTLLKEVDALIVEGNPRSLSTWLVLRQARRRQIPVAVWGHAFGRGAEEMAPGRRRMFSMGTAILCYCYEEVAPLRRLFPKKEILVAGNTVLRKSECRVLENPAEKRQDVLFLGRLIPEKKGLLFLKALRLLANRGFSIGAVVIGDGPDRAAMETYARETRLAGVRFAGFQSELETIRSHAQSTFCMVSTGYAGLSLLHAQSMGLPFIFSPEEPNAPEIEIAREGWNCLPFEKDNPASVADALETLDRNRNEWLGRGEAFTRELSEKYSIENMADQFCRFFRGEGKKQKVESGKRKSPVTA